MSKNPRNADPTRIQNILTSGQIEVLAYSVEEGATALGISRTATYKLIKEGKLKVVKIGRRTLVPRDSVQALMARLQGLEPWVVA